TQSRRCSASAASSNTSGKPPSPPSPLPPAGGRRQGEGGRPLALSIWAEKKQPSVPAQRSGSVGMTQLLMPQVAKNYGDGPGQPHSQGIGMPLNSPRDLGPSKTLRL